MVKPEPAGDRNGSQKIREDSDVFLRPMRLRANVCPRLDKEKRCGNDAMYDSINIQVAPNAVVEQYGPTQIPYELA